jgi:Ca2+-binding RTX toxin-like protein
VGVTSLQGGDGFDTLLLKAGAYDLAGLSVSGIEAVTFVGASFSLAERQKLYDQGVRSATDASGTHILQPSVVSLSRSVVQEDAVVGTAVGDLSATDPNPADSLRYELLDTAGGRFALQGNRLVVAGKLDYETASALQVVVRVTDEGGIATDKVFTIQVSDAVEVLKGTSRNDVLKGGAGRDQIWGMKGKDTLYGAGGQDMFVFSTRPGKSNVDKIGDFNAHDDALWLDNAVFKALGKKGSLSKPSPLKSAYFHAGSAAHDANDHIIYKRKTGALFYDPDGTGAQAQVHFATITDKKAVTYRDFFVI